LFPLWARGKGEDKAKWAEQNAHREPGATTPSFLSRNYGADDAEEQPRENAYFHARNTPTPAPNE
jgi:hypothetical protein